MQQPGKGFASTLLLGGVLLASASPVTADAKSGAHATYQVRIGVDFYYKGFVVNKYFPDKLTIHVGDSVRWTNVTSFRPQTVTFGPVLYQPAMFTRSDGAEINPLIVKPQGGMVVADIDQNVYSSGALVSGVHGLKTSYSFQFPTPGIFLYRSLFHPGMLGEIDVVPAGKAASPLNSDLGPSYYDALRSADKVIGDSLSAERTGGANGLTNSTVLIGGGDANISLAKFSPEGITVKVGTTVTWQTLESSGDPHVLVFNADIQGKDLNPPLYTAVSSDGGLVLNNKYTHPTFPSGTTIITSTAQLKMYSGVLYGSSVNSPSPVPNSYSLTFSTPGNIIYSDPFPPGSVGQIRVVQ
jgi:plastocyanin